MKHTILLVAMVACFSCKPKATVETVAEPVPTVQTADTLAANPPEQVPPAPSRSSSTSEAVDSITATPPNAGAKETTGPGGKKYEAPKTNPRPSAHECAPNINQLAKSQGSTHFIYVTGFDTKEFECWVQLEKHGESLCNNKPCKVYYLDSPQISVGSGANPIDAAALKTHGVGLFVHDGDFWEMKGANIWKRAPGYGYYNTNNHLGG